VQNELGVAKAFYFCFFGAFGSLFPLMAVFFKVKTRSLLFFFKKSVGFRYLFVPRVYNRYLLVCEMEYSILQGLGMDAAQCGFLIGVRPIIEYLATPFWHGMSDR
jgi:hypothetical protein